MKRMKKEKCIKLKPRNWTLKDVGKHWDSIIGYDEINKRTYSYFRRFTDGYRLSDIKDGAYVLDICCRTGNGTSYFAKQRKIRAVCADVADKMLQICKERLTEEGVNFKIKKFTTPRLPLKSNMFDNVLSFETLEHIPDPQAFIRELGRVLKKGGELILTCPNLAWEFVHRFAALTGIHHSEGPHRFIHRKKVEKMLRNAGFKIKKFETTVFIPYGPRFLTRLGEVFEKAFKRTLMPHIGLKYIFVCEKVK